MNDNYDDKAYFDFGLPNNLCLILPFTSSLSIFSSVTLLHELILELGENGRRTASSIIRTLIAISISDIIFSIALGFSTFPTPSNVPNVGYTFGNTATCEAQGFFVQLGVMTTPLFSTMLAFFHIVTIKLRWSNEKIQKYEYVLHAFIWIISLGCASFPLYMNLYNNAYHTCWINAYPDNCVLNDNTKCIRGENYGIYFKIFTIFPLWPCMVIMVYVMTILWISVRKIELAMSRYAGPRLSVYASSGEYKMASSMRHLEASNSNINGNNTNDNISENLANNIFHIQNPLNLIDRRRSKAVAQQGLAYIMAFVLSQILHLFATLYWFIGKRYNGVLYVFAYDIMLPLRGVFNFYAFCRKRDMKSIEGQLLKHFLCCEWIINGIQRINKIPEDNDNDSS